MPCWTLDELQAVGAYVDSKCHEKLEVDFFSKGYFGPV